MRTDALFEFASKRDVFNQTSAKLAARLAHAISAIAQAQSQPDISMAQLQHAWPYEAAQLASVLAEIRALSAALKELDDLHQQLASRALTFVRAYVSQLTPKATGYTRRGAQPIQHEAATRSERA
jgi:predicted RNA-binding protein associated with RNAse of E/G family